MGAHTLGFNTNSMGIAVLGTFGSHQPARRPPSNAIARLTAWKLGLYGVNPRGNDTPDVRRRQLYKKGTNVRLNVISGHRDGFATECPGARLYNKLGTARTASARSRAADGDGPIGRMCDASVTLATEPMHRSTGLPHGRPTARRRRHRNAPHGTAKPSAYTGPAESRPAPAGSRDDTVTEAILLVGGKGTRLRPLTVHTPKPMVPAAGVPFLTHQLARARAAGVEHIVLATSYLAEVFEPYFGDGSALGLHLEYVTEDEPLGTGGAIRNVASRLHSGPGRTGPDLQRRHPHGPGHRGPRRRPTSTRARTSPCTSPGSTTRAPSAWCPPTPPAG